MEKTYKRVPFGIELAKKIQSGEVEGRIVTNSGYAVRIICFDKRTSSGYPILGLVDYPNQSEMCKAFNAYGLCYDQPVEYILQIELPEETPKLDDITTREGFCRTFQKHGFKVGDKIRVNFPLERLSEMMISGCYQGKILTITRLQPYGVNAKGENIKETFFMFDEIEPYEEKHEFKPFDRVLVRDKQTQNWIVAQYNGIDDKSKEYFAGAFWKYCIPYEGNEHLVGTTNSPE